MTLPDEISQCFDGPHRDRLLRMRNIVLAAADATQTAPLTETLKWGQPSYLPPKRDGTTIRLGLEADRPALFVHCQTDLVSRCRILFPEEFTYSGNRAVLLPANEPFAEPALQQIAAMALTYHRDKRRSEM